LPISIKHGIGIDGKLYCEHNLVAPLRVGGTCTSRPGHEFYECPYALLLLFGGGGTCTSRPGHEFYECPYALRRGDCNVFFWKEDVDNYVLRGPEKRALEVQKKKLEEEKGVLERELACLKGKVDVYEAMLVKVYVFGM
ncbi:hypothetical protein M8C21_010020, partial [Ambrosia artemisiifolia]